MKQRNEKKKITEKKKQTAQTNLDHERRENRVTEGAPKVFEFGGGCVPRGLTAGPRSLHPNRTENHFEPCLDEAATRKDTVVLTSV